MKQKRLFFLIAILLVLVAIYTFNRPRLTKEKLTILVTKAVQDGNTRKVSSLIWKGADINASDEKGRTLLEVALLYGQNDMVKFLIDRCPDVNKKDARGMTPLGLVVGGYRSRKELPDAKDSDSYYERGDHFYWQHEFDRAIEDCSSAIRLNPENDSAYYCRGRAWAQKDNPQQAVADWKRAIELNWRNALYAHYGRQLLQSPDTELDCLIKDATMEHLEELNVVSGYAVGDVDSPGHFYTASLIISSPFEEERFLRMAQSNNPVVRAMAMICLARKDFSRHKKMIRSFYTDKAEVYYLPLGCFVTRITLGKLAKNMMKDRGVLDYWSAAHSDQTLNMSERDAEREAMVQQQIDVIQTLIAKGADINAKDQHGETPLAEHGSTRIAEFLIPNGADVTAKNNKGETPLHCATFWGYRQIVELLMAHGADINAKTNEGQTATDIAAQQDYPGLSTLLGEFGKRKQ
ncbi:MAG: ankyrin repeat domain-containing protein [Planctomycetota bacterium]|jgi:tetratricopeptide (TPR) repeat protein